MVGTWEHLQHPRVAQIIYQVESSSIFYRFRELSDVAQIDKIFYLGIVPKSKLIAVLLF